MMKRFITTVGLIAVAALGLTACSNDNTMLPDEEKPTIEEVNNERVDELYEEHYALHGTVVEFEAQTANYDREDIVAAFGQAVKYSNHTIHNEYFIADWWGTKDKYSSSGFKDVTDTIEGDFLDTFIPEMKTASQKNDIEVPLYVQTDGYEVLDNCYEEWEHGSCMVEPESKLELDKFMENEDGLLELTVKDKIGVFYNTPDGSKVEERLYSYTLQFNKGIWVTGVIDVSVEVLKTQSAEDYLVEYYEQLIVE